MKNWIDNLTNAAQWSQLAAMARLSVLFFKPGSYFVTLFNQKVRINKSLSDRQTISILVDSRMEDRVIHLYRSYFKRKRVFNFAFGKWVDFKQIPVSGNSGAYVMDKNDILRNCKSASDSCNFTLEIPNNHAAKQLYIAKLAYQGYIIRGRAKVSESDSTRWLIYFVHDLEPFHADSGHPSELKNSLIAL